MEFARWNKNNGTISLTSMVLDENAEGLERYEDATSRGVRHTHAKDRSGKRVLRSYFFDMLRNIDERNKAQNNRDEREDEKQSDKEMEKEAIAEAPSANEREDFMSQGSLYVESHNEEYESTNPHVTSSSDESKQMEQEKEDAIAKRKKEEEEKQKEEKENQEAMAEEGEVGTQSEVRYHCACLRVLLYQYNLL